MTVFAVHPVKDDLSPALHFGALRYIRTGYQRGGYIYPDELRAPGGEGCVFALPADWLDTARAAAAEFDPEADCLLMAGDHLQLLAFTALLIQRHGAFTALRFSREHRGYLPVKISGALE